MSLRVEPEHVVVNEAIAILIEHMPLDKVARVLSALGVGCGDYTKLRHELFAGMSVDDIFDEMEALEKARGTVPDPNTPQATLTQ